MTGRWQPGALRFSFISQANGLLIIDALFLPNGVWYLSGRVVDGA